MHCFFIEQNDIILIVIGIGNMQSLAMGRQILKYINAARRSPNILQGYSTQKLRFLTINAHQYHTNFVTSSYTSSNRLHLHAYAAQLQQTKSSKPNSLIIRQSCSRNLSSKPEQPENSLKSNKNVIDIATSAEDKAKLDAIKQFKSNLVPYLRLIRFDRPIGKEIKHS